MSENAANRGFLHIARTEIPCRETKERLADWQEVEVLPAERPLREQAERCMDCGVPFCQSDTGCPVQNVIPEWNSLAAQGRWQDAASKLLATNNFPELTGRLCPAPCESACVLGVNSDPVAIRALEWGIIERAFHEGWIQPQPPKKLTGKKIAIIGSGPTGLAAAQQLRRLGHEVTVFERERNPGGLLRYGIPDFKLQKEVIDRRLEQLRNEGVRFKTGVCLGKDLTYADLKAEFNAVALAIGAEKARDLSIPGRELNGIHLAMDFLLAQNRTHASEIHENPLSAKGKRVVVLGGGDTGSDCLGTALRQGAVSVVQIEIQPRPPEKRALSTPWPMFPLKLKTSHAHEEGGERLWGWATREFSGKDGQVSGLRLEHVGEGDPQGGKVLRLEADMVVLALGFTGVRRAALASFGGLEFSANGAIATGYAGSEFLTNLPGVFAAGDARRGASLVVWAIAEGRRMAQSIDQNIDQFLMNPRQDLGLAGHSDHSAHSVHEAALDCRL